VFIIASAYNSILVEGTLVYLFTYVTFYVLDFIGTSQYVFKSKLSKGKFLRYFVSVVVLLYIGSILFNRIFSTFESVVISTVLAGLSLAPIRYVVSKNWIYAEQTIIVDAITNILGSLVRFVYTILRRTLKLKFKRNENSFQLTTWAKSLLGFQNIEVLMDLDLPWWPFAVESKLASFLKDTKNARVFEWGSGASSFWLAKRSGSVISIEHDLSWTNKILEMIRLNGVRNLEIRHVGATPSVAPIISSDKSGYKNLDFESYVNTIDGLGKFDLIIIDGRARVDCWNRAALHLNPNGIIVLDNSNRKRYKLATSGFNCLRLKGLTPASPWMTESIIAHIKI